MADDTSITFTGDDIARLGEVAEHLRASDERGSGQLSLFVAPDKRARGAKKPLEAELKLGGAVAVHRDLQQGERLTVQVCNADGEVIAAGEYEVDVVSFPPIRVDGSVIGICRSHKLKLREGALILAEED